MYKIAFVSPGFAPVPAVNGGGVEQLMDILIKDNEIKRKCKIDVYSIYDEKSENIKFKNSNLFFFKTNIIQKIICKAINIICRKLTIKRSYSNYNSKVSKKISIIKNYDYIIVENNMYLYKKIYDAYKGNAKFIFHLHNDINNFDKPIELCKFIDKTAYKIITVSQFLKNRFIQYTKSNKVDVLYNCVNIEEFSKIKINKKELYKKFQISEDDIKFLFCGRFHEEKGLLELIQAFNNVSKKYDNIKLLILGQGTKKSFFGVNIQPPYEKLIYENIAKNKNIILCGYINREELSSYYNLSDVVVIPSNCDEAFGLVTIEAMALYKPLIVSDGGALPEIVNQNFAYIAKRDKLTYNLSKGIECYIHHKKNIKDLGIKAHDNLTSNSKYDENFYYDNFLEEIL